MNHAVPQLQFENTRFDVIERDGEVWLRVQQIAVALGYSRPDVLQQVYKSNAAEFNHNMTALLKLPTNGGEQTVRVFSLRGAHLLGMFARTPKAAEFRRWVLDVLEAAAKGHSTPNVDMALMMRTLAALLERAEAREERFMNMVERLLPLANKPRRKAKDMYVADRDRIVAMRQGGASLESIMAATGFSQTQVSYVMTEQTRTKPDGRVVLVHRARMHLREAA